MSGLPRIVKTAGAVVLVAAVIRAVTGIAPVAAAALVGATAVGASAYGLWANGRGHGRAWRVAWASLGLGLLGIVSAAVVEAVLRPAGASNPGALVVLSLCSAVFAGLGLVSLIRQRLPGRAAEALAEAISASVALGLVIVGLVLIPAHAWHPARDLPQFAVSIADLVVLWLGVSLVSLTARHPTGFRYLIAGFACVLVASSVSSGFVIAGRSSAIPLDAVMLWGACLWAGGLLHPSQRSRFDPVPARSTRPSPAHATLMLVCALVVPTVLFIRLLDGGASGDEGLAVVATLLPLLIVIYLLHKVFAHAAAEYRAQHDPLTGICNRTLFEERLKASLTLAQRSGSAVGVMYVDVDRFKSINDSLGHAVGNQVLQAVVGRLQSCMRAQDTVARMGGDEFTLLLPDLKDKVQCANFAERAVQTFEEPIAVSGRLLSVQASVGIALFPEDGDDAESLLKNADTAMYQAKSSGRNTFEVYDATMSAQAQLRFALEASLRAAMESGRLAVHYQPKYITATGEIGGFEALARWRHARLGFIPPWAFIPLAEESNLVDTLGEWVLETACRQARDWQENGLLQVPVAVNMSARQFARQPIVSMVSDVLCRTGLDANMLEIEVTESVLVEHREEVTETLRELRAMGVRCSIDDFGTGYSALTYLAEFPVDAIKIDRSFVMRIDSDPGAASIVGAVIAMAHSLGLQVVAEGVETASQLQFLKDHDCDLVQGFHFSPACPADEFEALVRAPLVVDQIEVFDTAGTPAAYSVISSSRLDSILDGMVQRSRSAALDLDGIESVLAALEPDHLLVLDDPRPFGALPARLALGTLAGLTSLTGGLAAVGAIPRATQEVALRIVETGTGLAPQSTPSSDPAPQGGQPQAPSSGTSGETVGNPAPLEGASAGSSGTTAVATPGGSAGAGPGTGGPGSNATAGANQAPGGQSSGGGGAGGPNQGTGRLGSNGTGGANQAPGGQSSGGGGAGGPNQGTGRLGPNRTGGANQAPGGQGSGGGGSGGAGPGTGGQGANAASGANQVPGGQGSGGGGSGGARPGTGGQGANGTAGANQAPGGPGSGGPGSGGPGSGGPGSGGPGSGGAASAPAPQGPNGNGSGPNKTSRGNGGNGPARANNGKSGNAPGHNKP